MLLATASGEAVLGEEGGPLPFADLAFAAGVHG
jgi:hypothetical protein